MQTRTMESSRVQSTDKLDKSSLAVKLTTLFADCTPSLLRVDAPGLLQAIAISWQSLSESQSPHRPTNRGCRTAASTDASACEVWEFSRSFIDKAGCALESSARASPCSLLPPDPGPSTVCRFGSWPNVFGLQSERLFNFEPTTNSLQLDLGSIFTLFLVSGGRIATLVDVAAFAGPRSTGSSPVGDGYRTASACAGERPSQSHRASMR